MESSWVSLGAVMLSSSEFSELYYPQSRWLRFCCEVIKFPQSCLGSNTVRTKAPSVLDWSMDHSYQPVVVSHEYGSVEGSLVLLVNDKAWDYITIFLIDKPIIGILSVGGEWMNRTQCISLQCVYGLWIVGSVTSHCLVSTTLYFITWGVLFLVSPSCCTQPLGSSTHLIHTIPTDCSFT